LIYAPVYNDGNYQSDTTYTVFLLSTDQIPDASDIVITVKKTDPVIPFSYYYIGGLSVNFPASIPDGDYYVIAYADHTHVHTEPSESNNYAVTKLILGNGSGTIYNLTNGGHTVHTTCQEVIYDSGGNGPYSNNEHSCLTLYPGISGNFVSLEFLYMDIEACCDNLSIYNGPTTSDSLIGIFSSIPSTIVSTHPTGSLRLKFLSNSSTTRPGFKAIAKCVPYVKPDLSINTNYYGTPEFVQGETSPISYYVNNTGTCTAGATHTGFYLSFDSILDATDILIENDLSDHTPPGNSVYNIANLFIPSSISPGNYYLILQADNTGILNETDETNNSAFRPVKIHPALIDLVSSSLYIYSGYYSYIKFYPGALMDVSSSVSNREYKKLDTSVVRYYFSIDTLLDTSDIQAAYSYRGSTTPSRHFNHAHDSLIIPLTLAPGNYYLLAEADPFNMFAETNESNNIKYTPILLHSPTIDIAFNYVNLQDYTPVQGGNTTLGFSIKDIGNISLPNSTLIGTSYYLSNDSIFDPSDISLGSSTNMLHYSVNQTLTIPSGISPGTYHLILHLDTANTYTESDETNNFHYLKIDVHPNISELSIENFYMGYQPILINSTVGYSYTIMNRGHGTVTGAMIHYCFSNDSILDVNDTLLSMGSASIPGNHGTNMNPYHWLPSGVSGFKYIILRLDPFNMIAEPDETNNVLIIPFNIENKIQDLRMTDISLGVPAVSTGANLSVKSSLRISGNVSLNNQTIGYYFSSDTLFDAGDISMGSSIVSWVSPGATPIITNSTVTIPLVTNGLYYILFKADHNNITSETNESNNVSFSPIIVVPPSRDLYVKTIRITDYSVASGSSLNVRPLVFNSGSASSGSYKIGYYLSSDSVFSAGDLFVTSQIRNDLAIGACDSTACTLNIPTSVSAGNYFVIAYADYMNVVAETSEANNYFSNRVSVVTGFSDLVKGGMAASYYTSTNLIAINFNYRNRCNLYQFNVKTAFYLSADTLQDAGDALLGTNNASVISPGQSYGYNLNFTAPSGTSPFSYYVIAKIDYLNAIPESNESNNTYYTRLTSSYSSYAPDLRISEIELKDTLSRESSNPFSAQIDIYGGSSATSPVGIYLSSDWQFDYMDLLLVSLDSGILNSYDPKTIHPEIILPSWINPGLYYLISAIDPLNVIQENNELNNVYVKPVYIASITGIVENAEDFEFIIYPNPSSGQLNFKGHFTEEEWGKELMIEVINTKGEVVFRDEFRNDIDIDKKISIEEVNNGIYFLKISGSRKSIAEKYVKID
jgi:subtilase family serine protease